MQEAYDPWLLAFAARLSENSKHSSRLQCPRPAGRRSRTAAIAATVTLLTHLSAWTVSTTVWFSPSVKQVLSQYLQTFLTTTTNTTTTTTTAATTDDDDDAAAADDDDNDDDDAAADDDIERVDMTGENSSSLDEIKGMA